MYLDWDTKITDVLTQLGVDPELYNEDEELKEWVAKNLGFKDYATFFALASAKDILGGMALDMLPEHNNFQWYLAEDCATLIGHNYELYKDYERMKFEIENFLRFIDENFTNEMIIVAIMKLKANAERVVIFLPLIESYNTLMERHGHLTAEI